MTAVVQSGFSSTLEVDTTGSGSYSVIPNQRKFSGPKSKMNMVNVPIQGVNGLGKRPGELDFGEYQVEFYEDQTDTVHALLWTNYTTRVRTNFRVTYKPSNATYTFSAYIGSWDEDGQDNDNEIATTISLAVDGAITRV